MRQVLSGKHLCVNVCDEIMWQGLKQDVVRHISIHTHTVTINEISQKWRYIHCLQHCTFMPRYTSSQWDRIHYTLPWGKRRRRRAQLTRWTGAGGWKGATMKKSWSVRTSDEQDRALYNMGKQQWINISPDLAPAPSGAASYNDCIDNLASKALIQHIFNNWCESKHWRYMHTQSECISSTCGRSTLCPGFFINLVCRQLEYLSSLFTAI